jgi:ribonucleoside-diphosphate reductase alpha subunit
MIENMFVVKRSGEKEAVAFEKVQQRISKVSEGLAVNATKVAQGVLTRIVDGISTTELDTIAANLAFSWCTSHPDYGTLAGRIAISNHQKNTPATLLECVERLDATKDRAGNPASLLSAEYVAVVRAHATEIESHIDYERDYLLDYFGFKTLERAYLLRDTNRVVIERPQHLWMRVALGLWGHDLPKAFETYDMISRKLYTHATPTLFNAATKRPQLSSCFLLGMEDSIVGIYKALTDCALISQYGGGIGVHISDIRAQGSLIKGTGGVSNGIVPMLRVFNNTARYVDQCFTPETEVFTLQGPKQIGQVGVGEKLLGSDGHFHTVKRPVRHMWQNGTLLRIHLQGMHQSIRVTPEHQILMMPADSESPVFVDASELREGDFLVFPTPQYEEDVEFFSEEDCRMYGILLASGHFVGHMVEAHLPEYSSAVPFVRDYLNRRGIETYTKCYDSMITISWSVTNAGWKFTTQMFRSEKGDERPHFYSHFLHLPLAKIRIILYALEELRFTGCRSEIQYLHLRTRDHTLCNGASVVVPIERIETTAYSGIVHDFEVDGPHDYTVACLGVAHNGGGKRNGSFAMYLEPWHADVEAFLEMKKNTGAEEERARDLFYALWIPDLFMERVDANADWTLFCPYEAPGLADAVGDEFKALYERYEREGRGRKTVKAQTLWFHILDSQIETGTPYLVYKDSANLKSNQQNYGTIKSSNLCSEIIEYSDSKETAVCNLASMSLPSFVKQGAFDFTEFRKVVKMATYNLNRVIDVTYYPTPEARLSNLKHRPIGIGVQGLADVFAMLQLPWESEEASALNKRIFAHMYYAALEASCDLAAKEGVYETYIGSPAHKGKLQFDLWGQEPLSDPELDWDGLINAIHRIGLRNSLLVAPMPTASTSQILGNCECFEPYATHIFTRRTLAGEFIVVNKHLVKALLDRGLWSETMKNNIIANNGSVLGLPDVPEDLQKIFKTVWEIKQKTLIDMAADRGPYICQSQSLNLFLGDPDYRKLTSMHFYAWRKGLKTGIYYLRTRAVASAQKFTVEPVRPVQQAEPAEPTECLMCSS